jgi:hypothetical protein
MKMISRIISKSETHKMIKALRAAGLQVDKIEGSYECKIKNTLVFKAMPGNNGYLIRMAENLFN